MISLPLIRRWRRLVFFVSAVAILLGATALVLPGYVKNRIEQQVAAQLGRKLDIASLSINPLTLSTKVERLVLYEADRKTPAVQAESMTLRLSPAVLWQRTLVARALQIDGLQMHVAVEHEGQRVSHNFSDIVQRIEHMPPSEKPFRFSLANIQLKNSEFTFDNMRGNTHDEQHFALRKLTFDLPFVSNFPSAEAVYVEPKLSFELNGRPVHLAAHSQPFEKTHTTELAIDLDDFDVTPFTPLLPSSFSYHVQSAKLTTRLKLAFAAHPEHASITLSGQAAVRQLVLHDRHGAPLLSAEEIATTLEKVDLVDLVGGEAHLRQLDLRAPQVWFAIDKDGHMKGLAQEKPAAKHGTKTQAPENPAHAKASFTLDKLHLENGQIHLQDARYAQPVFTHDFEKLMLDADHLSTTERMHFDLRSDADQSLQLRGEVDLGKQEAEGELMLKDWHLADWQPYWNLALAGKLQGALGASAAFHIENGQVKVKDGRVQLDAFAFTPNDTKIAAQRVHKLALEQFELDSETHKIALDKIAIEGITGGVTRVRDGFDLLQLSKSISHAKPAGKPWQFSLRSFDVRDSAWKFLDQTVEPAVNLQAQQIAMHAENLHWPMQGTTSLRLQTQLNRQAAVSIEGATQGSSAQMKIDVRNFPLMAITPYIAPFLNVDILSGSVGTTGRFNWRGGQRFAYEGQVRAANLKTQDQENGEEFLSWKSLAIDGVKYADDEGKRNVEIGKIALKDFFARMILSEQGKLNLRDIVRDRAPENARDKPEDAQTSTGSASLPPRIVIGQVELTGGTVDYTDHFIKPNYNVKVSGLRGSLGRVASDVAQSADLNLDGKIDGDAPVAISGALNPLFKPMRLDIKTTASDIELPRLSTYSAKYAGYGIEKGKLSMDVHYHVEDNQLNAENNLVLDQLTFGDRIDSPSATKLPVQLIVALLKDRDGRINLNLPISGTLSDPEFSVGGLIFRVLVNLVGKVVTSPFALLSHVFSNADELAYAEFASGADVLTDATQAKLLQIAQALEHRPVLKLDIKGRADLQADAEGLRKNRLEQQVAHQSGQANPDAQQRAKAIEKLYGAAKFDKPRNFLGLSKSLPSGEMEQRLLTGMVISQDDLLQLATRRAQAARQFLEAQGHVAPERMFLVAPHLDAEGLQDKGAASRVDFNLKME